VKFFPVFFSLPLHLSHPVSHDGGAVNDNLTDPACVPDRPGSMQSMAGGSTVRDAQAAMATLRMEEEDEDRRVSP
jgi:hypothetical protein